MAKKSAAVAELVAQGHAPRGLARECAAAYVGVSATLFDEMVSDGRMPTPRVVGARRIWDLRALDKAFERLPGQDDAEREAADVWSSVAV
ncbi:MAG: hypothetical protein ACOYLQ_08025 [Hyphomicrobiaceae bacterium]